MSKRWYAFKNKNGEGAVLFDEWENFNKIASGKKGSMCKGFGSQKAALEWLNKPSIPYRALGQAYTKGEVYIFVDGSYSSTVECSGWGWVAVLNGENIGEGWGVRRGIRGSRNIIGELDGATNAIKWAISAGFKQVTIVHDYMGIGAWALGYWGAKTKVASEYIKFIDSVRDSIELKFEKVRGHCGISWNEYADELTRKYQTEEAS